MKTLLFGVLYPGLDDALIVDYVRSIVEQEDKAFDWLMVNDNAGNLQVQLFPENVEWINVYVPSSMGKIREIGIAYAKERHYDGIVFSDIDDYYSPERLGKTKLHLEENDFVFTELQVVNFEKQLKHKDLISSWRANPAPGRIQDIIDYNYIGLSHSAVRIGTLDDLEIPTDIKAVDWWIFSLLLISGYKGKLLPDVDTFYRQNGSNYVGVYNLLDSVRLQQGIDVKLKHYGGLRGYCQKRKMQEISGIFDTKYQEMIELQDLTKETGFSHKYVAVINNHFNKLYKGWWSEILPLNQWEKYER